MIANYHTHTARCRHAEGSEREYVEKAIEGGLRILGFSDHVPVPFEGDYVSPVRMKMDEMEDYVDTVLALKSEYAREIEIHLGFEVEYYPRYIEAQRRAMEPYPIEYFLLGQHFMIDESAGPYSGHPTTDEAVLFSYCEQCTLALESGLFTYFAHPDLIHFLGNETLYERCMRDLCVCAKRHAVPLEINLLGIETRRNYPKESFWKIAGEVGNDVVLGSDAHMPGNVYRPDAIAAATEMTERCGLKILDTVQLVEPKNVEK